MMKLYEKIWLRYVRERIKKKGFHKSLMVMTTFKAQFTDGVTATMLIGHTGVVKNPCRVYI